MRRKVPIILQLSDTECGLASLAMIFAYYQHPLPLEKLRDQVGPSRDGCKAQTLLNLAAFYKFKAEAFSIDIAELQQLRQPVIAYWGFRHYVVINSVDTKFAHINDPAMGYCRIALEEVDKLFTGVIINIEPLLTNKFKINKLENIKKAAHYIKRYKNELAFLLTCTLLSTISSSLNSAVYNIFIDKCMVNKRFEWILGILFFFILTSGMYLISQALYKKLAHNLQQTIGYLKCSQLINRLLLLPLSFYELRQRGEIAAILARTNNAISSLLNTNLQFTANLLSATFCFILMARLSVKLTIASVLLSFAYLIICLFILRTIGEAEKQLHFNTTKQFVHTNYWASNIEPLRACSLESLIYTSIYSAFIKKIHTHDTLVKIKNIHSCISSGYQYMLIITLIFTAVFSHEFRVITVGNFLLFHALQFIFYSNITSIINDISEFKKQYISYNRINDIYTYPLDARFQEKPSIISPINDHYILSGNNLFFSYSHNSLPTLSCINFNIKQGEHIAFIGPTGSGKSTLAKIIGHLIQPQQGCLLLMGKPINDYSASELAKKIAYVPQESVLFSSSLYENLTLGNQTITIEEIYEAINIAQLNDVVANIGLHNMLQANCTMLSGGERQRVDIARALLQKTDILILDEATSALDNQCEIAIINSLKRVNKTVIFIAHRLPTIKHCNQIYVLENGQVSQQGTHEDLIVKNGYYQHALSYN